MAVEIPVVVDIDSAFADAAKRVDSAIKPLESRISKKQLKADIVVEVDKKGAPKTVKKLKEILNSTTISSKQLRIAMAQVRSELEALDAAGKLKSSKGLSAHARDLLATYSALETKLRGGSVIDNLANSIARTGTAAEVAGRKAQTAIAGTNNGLATQKGLLSSLIGSFSLYTAAFAGLRLIRNIRNVTAEFEMQRVALGGIIQDSTRAGRLFAEIKAAAVQSPFEIKDLVSFTKQLSAYRIETDKLFDVTMRLADVSAGLGVDMSRLVLAYGQVRAASVLRGQELRQFTEAGIPLVDLLAKKFSQLRGEMVSTGEVFELISNRAVPFAMIEEIFNDMTNAGGIFYEMQLKQSETLKGQWMKLKDVFSIALDEMGRTSIVSDMMRGWITIISRIVKAWESLAQVVNVAVWGYVSYQAAMKGLIPFYNMHRKAIARQVALEKQQQIEEIKLAATGRNLTVAENKRIAALKKLTAEDYKRIYSMKSMSKAQAMLTFYHNQNNKEIVKAITQTGLLTKAQMKAIGQMNGFQLRLKVWGTSIRTFFTSIGTAIASFWPIAAVSAAISMITSLISAHREQVEAIRKVDKAYQEQDLVIRGIETAYLRLKQAIAAVTDESKRAQMEASSFGEKLGYAQQIVEQLKKNGLGGDFDLSLLNDSNIDEFIEKWLAQLDEANRASQEWGRSLAQTLNAAEGVFHILGDNLSTDIKDLTNSYVKLTTNKTYVNDVKRMRAWVENLEVSGKKYYDQLVKTLGEDAKLAIATKRRNESEYQYQMRLIANYQKIQRFAQSDDMLLSGKAGYFESMSDKLRDFNSDLDEVEYEFDKTWGALSGKDPITIKMAIDKMFAENAWEDWLKEAWIERLNGKYSLNLEITPSVATPNVARGMKSILTTDFPTLFSAQELENMNSVTEIGAAIEKKMSDAAAAIESANKQANNYASSEAAISRVQEAQKRIQDELAKDEKDRNNDAIRDAYEVIDAITKQNEVYDTQIQKKKEAAAAEYELAKAAKERLMNENLSDLAKDIKQAFPELLADGTPGSTQSNRFLISDEDLKNIQDGVDAYDIWAKNMKAVADEKEKLDKAGVDEATVAAEQAEIDAKRVELQSQLDAINEKIKNSNYERVRAEYDSLRYAVESSTTMSDKLKAQENLKKFLKQTNVAEAAALFLERQRLTQELGIQNAALGAKQAIIDTFKSIDDAGKFWEEFGKRYNFTLQNNGGGSQQDPWIMIFKNRMKFVQDFQKGVQKLETSLGNLGAVGRERGIMEGRGLSLGFNGKDELDVRSMTGSREEVLKWYDDTIKKIQEKIGKLGGRTWAGLGVQAILAKDTKSRTLKAWQELLADVFNERTDFELNQLTSDLERGFQKVRDNLKKSETVRNFYNGLLEATGDKDLATTLTMTVYGNADVEGFADSIKKSLADTLGSEMNLFRWAGMSNDMEKAFDDLDFDYIFDHLAEFPDEIKNAFESAGISKAMVEAFKSSDIDYIEDHIDELPEDMRKNLDEIISEVRKHDASWLSDIVKTYQKHKDFETRKTEVAQKEAEKRIEIQEWETKQLARIQREYDAEVASIDKDQTLSEEQKEEKKVQAKQKADDQSAAIKKQSSEAQDASTRKEGEETASIELEALKTTYEWTKAFEDLENVSTATLNSLIALLDEYIAKAGATASPEDLKTVTQAKEKAEDQVGSRGNSYKNVIKELKSYISAKKRANKLEKEGKKDTVEYRKAQDDARKSLKKAEKSVGEIGNSFNTLGDIVNSVSDILQLDELSDGQAVLSGIAAGLTLVGTALIFINAMFTMLESNPVVLAISAIIASVAALAMILSNLTTASANREIEKQKKVVKNLEKEYDRLEKAMEEAFGGDYIADFNAQQKVLEAQIVAYNKMIAAERSKGKKTDEDKIEEYMDKIEEAQEKLKDMETQLSEHFSGTDLTSAARDFAEAWIDAYKEFSSTTTAMKDKFREMIQNMVVESLAASIMQKILQPVFDEIDRLAEEGGELSESDIAKIATMSTTVIDQANSQLTALMQNLAKAGVNMRDTTGLSGIAKDLAGASEQSINGLAAGINTQNYYMSYVPTISADVAAIRAAIVGTAPAANPNAAQTSSTGGFGDETFRGQMQRIDENIADMRSMLKSVITPKAANTNTHCIGTK